MLLSACGLKCSDCQFYNNACCGCYHVEGKTFWAQEATPEKICPLYNCSVNKKGFQHCGECEELPCSKFQELKDPNIREEEHLQSITDRVNRLLKN